MERDVLMALDADPGVEAVASQPMWLHWVSEGHHVLQERASAGLDLARHRLGQVRRRIVLATQDEASLVAGGELDPDAERPDRLRFRHATENLDADNPRHQTRRASSPSAHGPR